jgi:nitrate/nitrite transporter NarK
MWLTNIYSMVGGIPRRLVLGPLCDQYGVCILITLMLVGGAIPCLCTGLITNLLYMGKCADCCCNDMLDLY